MSGTKLASRRPKLEVAATTKKDEKLPIPKDKKQGKQYVVDHVLELQVAVAAFKEKKQDSGDKAKAISDKAWEKAKNAVSGEHKKDCNIIAKKISRSTSENNSNMSANLV